MGEQMTESLIDLHQEVSNVAQRARDGPLKDVWNGSAEWHEAWTPLCGEQDVFHQCCPHVCAAMCQSLSPGCVGTEPPEHTPF